MPTIVTEPATVYVATEPFETVIETPGPEFVAQGNSNGLSRESLLKRTYLVGQEATVQIEGINVHLPVGKQLTDVGQAFKALKQKPGAILVRDRIRVEAGQELPLTLGEALAESKRYPVKARVSEATEGEQEPSDPEAGSNPEDDLTPAQKAAARRAAAAAAKKAAEAEKAAEGEQE